MFDSLQPHGLYPARLLCSWNFPGKNTGMGCHFLLREIYLTQDSNLCLLHWQVDFFFFFTTETPGKSFPKCPPPHPLQKVYHFLCFSSPRFRFLLTHFRTLKTHIHRYTHTALKSKFPPPPGQQGPIDLTVYCFCIWPVSLPSKQVLRAKLLLSCLSLCNPMDCRTPVSSVHGASPRQEYGEGCHFRLQGFFPTQGWNPGLLCLQRWQARSFPLAPPGKPWQVYFLLGDLLLSWAPIPDTQDSTPLFLYKTALWSYLKCQRLTDILHTVTQSLSSPPSPNYIRFC